MDDVEVFRSRLAERGVTLSLLVATRSKDGSRLESDVETVEWLATQRALGSAIVLHGHNGPASLPAHEANLRLIGADRILEHLNLRTRLFAAPGWTVSAGTLKALPRNGFRMVAGWQGVTDLFTGHTQPDRLLGVGAGFLTDPWWCKTVLLSAERMARRGATVRLAVSGKQLGKNGSRKAMLDAVDLALRHGSVPAVYRWTGGATSRYAA